MRGELQGHLGVTDGDVGMMLCLLGDFREVVDKVDRVIEFLELDGSGDGFFFILPLGAFFQRGGEIVGFKKFGHDLNRERFRSEIAASASELASPFPRIVKINNLQVAWTAGSH
jgi:hypothetical protein